MVPSGRRTDPPGSSKVTPEPAASAAIPWTENGIAVIRCTGDCPDCDLSVEMLTVGIEAHLRQQVPEIRSIRFVAR
jgi:Fe-S cluster biogenesis protein NfuA